MSKQLPRVKIEEAVAEIPTADLIPDDYHARPDRHVVVPAKAQAAMAPAVDIEPAGGMELAGGGGTLVPSPDGDQSSLAGELPLNLDAPAQRSQPVPHRTSSPRAIPAIPPSKTNYWEFFWQTILPVCGLLMIFAPLLGMIITGVVTGNTTQAWAPTVGIVVIAIAWGLWDSIGAGLLVRACSWLVVLGLAAGLMHRNYLVLWVAGISIVGWATSKWAIGADEDDKKSSRRLALKAAFLAPAAVLIAASSMYFSPLGTGRGWIINDETVVMSQGHAFAIPFVAKIRSVAKWYDISVAIDQLTSDKVRITGTAVVDGAWLTSDKVALMAVVNQHARADVFINEHLTDFVRAHVEEEIAKTLAADFRGVTALNVPVEERSAINKDLALTWNGRIELADIQANFK